MTTFFTVFLGQLVSLLGSRLTGFSVGTWVFQSTGSTTLFALSSMALMVPGIVVSPLAGLIADRWDRRRVMLLCDLGGGASSLVAALLFRFNRAEVWSVCLIAALTATFDALRTPAWTAATTTLVPREHLGRASGMVQLSTALSQLVAPVLGGLLLVAIGMHGVLLIDVATFGIAFATLASVRFPRLSPEERSARSSAWREALKGWVYVRERQGLLGIMLFGVVLTFLLGLTQIALGPLVLSTSSPAVLGTILSVSGLGMLVGSITMSAWGGPKRRMTGVFLFAALEALSIGLVAFLPVGPLLSIAYFSLLLWMPFFTGSSQVIWQHKVPPELQGRTFALRSMVYQAATLLSYVLVGPLVDRLFEPTLLPGGALVASLGGVFGVGKGRGTALLFLVVGLFMLAATAALYLTPRVRRVEDELPDAIPDAIPDANVPAVGANGT